MTSVTFTSLRANLAKILDAVNQNREPVTVTRRDKGDVIVIDANEYAKMKEIICQSTLNSRLTT